MCRPIRVIAFIIAALLVQGGTSGAAEVNPFQDSLASPDGSASAAMADALANKPLATTAPSFIKQPAHIRPEAAKLAGEFGVVILSGIIDEYGKFAEPKVKVSSRSALIDAAALASVDVMLFEPARDADGKALSIPANLPLEYSQVAFHGPAGLAHYRCDQFVRDYDWWYRTWPADQEDRVFKTLRGFAFVADMQTGKTVHFDTEWKSAIESCRRSPSKLMLDQLKPHGALFRGMTSK